MYGEVHSVILVGCMMECTVRMLYNVMEVKGLDVG